MIPKGCRGFWLMKGNKNAYTTLRKSLFILYFFSKLRWHFSFTQKKSDTSVNVYKIIQYLVNTQLQWQSHKLRDPHLPYVTHFAWSLTNYLLCCVFFFLFFFVISTLLSSWFVQAENQYWPIDLYKVGNQVVT